ncbi:MAG: calcium-translocating P-type ATPase, PMCA-type [Prevotella sp.]
MEEKENKLYTGSEGLNEQEVAESRRVHGTNTLTPPEKTSLWKLYLEKYRDPIIQILLVAAGFSLILSFIENEFVEVIGIFLAIFFATTVGFYFERDAAKKFSVLTSMSEEQPVKVRRNGKVTEIPRREVVVGDIMLIEVGDEIPADGKLITAVDLQIDESSLTGEPITSKRTGTTGKKHEDTYPADLVLRSTMVMNGRGEARVTAVGDATEIGKVAMKSTELTATKTPLNIQLDKLAKLISKIGAAVAIAAFVIFLVHDILTNDAVWKGSDYVRMLETVLNYFMMSVTLIVMAVPEGLPMAVTLSLALNMRRMLKSNNLVRKLHACETMGAVTVICTDKTGTLTQNRMQVGAMYRCRTEGANCITDDMLEPGIAINTTAELDGEKGIGNPTEVALLLWLRGQGVDYLAQRKRMKMRAQLPFSTERKFMATIAETESGRYLYVKGAPEIIMDFCLLSPEVREKISHTLLGYQQKAMRTLAFAYKELGKNDPLCFESLLSGLTFQAVAAISDPVRDDVPQAVSQCINAGIEVKVITGDTSATAVEIGRQIGVWESQLHDDAQHITGQDFETLPDEEAYEKAASLKIMSRARPTDKQRLVEMLKRRGEIVAVTGDGTNDAPALNHAHVGLSLGSGTSVAKEASDMTLLDDSFGSIVRAVMWGRSLYKNIQRFLFFQLVVNLTALLLVLGGSVIGTEMPLTVTQILWVNLIMDTFAAMALASLPPSREVMRERPRKPSEFIITRSMAQGIMFCGLTFFIAMFIFLIYCERNGCNGVDVHELTLFFTSFVMLQFWNLFNAKTMGSNHSSFRRLWADRGFIVVSLSILLGQWLIVQFGGKMFRTVPMTIHEWLMIVGLTSIVLWTGELWRWQKRIRARRTSK